MSKSYFEFVEDMYGKDFLGVKADKIPFRWLAGKFGAFSYEKRSV